MAFHCLCVPVVLKRKNLTIAVFLFECDGDRVFFPVDGGVLSPFELGVGWQVLSTVVLNRAIDVVLVVSEQLQNFLVKTGNSNVVRWRDRTVLGFGLRKAIAY